MGVYGLGSTMHAASSFWYNPSQPEAEPNTQNIWDHVEFYVTHTSGSISRLFFYLPKIKLIISFFRIHNHISFNNASTCKPHLGKLVNLACCSKAAYGPRSTDHNFHCNAFLAFNSEYAGKWRRTKKAGHLFYSIMYWTYAHHRCRQSSHHLLSTPLLNPYPHTS